MLQVIRIFIVHLERRLSIYPLLSQCSNGCGIEILPDEMAHLPDNLPALETIVIVEKFYSKSSDASQAMARRFIYVWVVVMEQDGNMFGDLMVIGIERLKNFAHSYAILWADIAKTTEQGEKRDLA